MPANVCVSTRSRSWRGQMRLKNLFSFKALGVKFAMYLSQGLSRGTVWNWVNLYFTIETEWYWKP